MTKKLVSIWAANLDSAIKLINEYNLADDFVQFTPDMNHTYALWVVLRLHPAVATALEKIGRGAIPRWTTIGF